MKNISSVKDIQQAYREAFKSKSRVYIMKDIDNNLYIVVGNNIESVSVAYRVIELN